MSEMYRKHSARNPLNKNSTANNSSIKRKNHQKNNNSSNRGLLGRNTNKEGGKQSSLLNRLKNGSSNQYTENQIDEKSNDVKLKMPKPLKQIVMIGLVFLGLFFGLIMLVAVIFGDEDIAEEYGAGSSSESDSYKYGTTCTNVTVTDSGCDNNGQNCTNEYDGEVAYEDYIAGVVAAEASGSANLEYYKALAVTARTYFLNNTNDECVIKGNIKDQKYIDVSNHQNSDIIKQAVEETKSLVLTKKEKLSKIKYCDACVVNADSEYYHIRYGTAGSGKAMYQKIPKSWDNDTYNIYKGKLASLYNQIDKASTDYDSKNCAENNNSDGISKIGALYLTEKENYTYDKVLEYYYGNDIDIVENSMLLSGANGFVNPTRKIYCSSAFGNRIHPVKNTTDFHTGLDIGISMGEPIYAAKDGTITAVVKNVNAINNCQYGYGNYIKIEHENGISTLYAHIKYGSISDDITVGTTVKKGEQIALVGSTGCSTGAHLHYEVIENGSNVDPSKYLNLTEATGECKR